MRGTPRRPIGAEGLSPSRHCGNLCPGARRGGPCSEPVPSPRPFAEAPPLQRPCPSDGCPALRRDRPALPLREPGGRARVPAVHRRRHAAGLPGRLCQVRACLAAVHVAGAPRPSASAPSPAPAHAGVLDLPERSRGLCAVAGKAAPATCPEPRAGWSGGGFSRSWEAWDLPFGGSRSSLTALLFWYGGRAVGVKCLCKRAGRRAGKFSGRKEVGNF